MVSLIAAIVFFAAGQEKSLLQQVVPQPTGQNGYEDYLRGCDALGDRETTGAYMRWAFNVVPPDKDEVAQMNPLNRRLSAMNVYEVRKEAAGKYAQSLAFLRRGNQKKVWDPREKIGAQTLFPELAEFKNLAKLADVAAYVAFAEGRTREGTQYLIDEYQLGQNLEGGILISHLVGLAIEGIAFTGFERHLAGLSRADAAMIEKVAPGLVAGTPRIVESLKNEKKLIIQSMADFLAQPDSWNESSDDAAAKWPKEDLKNALKALTPSQRQSLCSQTDSLMDVRMQPLLVKFEGPESGWGDELTEATEQEIKQPTQVSDLPTYWAMEMTPVFSQSGIASARRRTQIRLLGLHAAVIRYMWDNNKLPSSLADVVTKDLIEDPLSGNQFIYERQGTWSFRIYSPGSKSTGEIGLRYRRASGSGGGDTDPVPPR